MPQVVSCLLIHEGTLLILKRSTKVKTYKGFWGAVAGYVEANEEPFETAIKEIREEVGLDKDDVRFIKKGETVNITDIYEGERYDWVIYPFVFYVEKKGKVQIDWEHSKYKWIVPSEISRYKTVPHLKEIIRQHLQ